jgi:hypothetical protein
MAPAVLKGSQPNLCPGHRFKNANYDAPSPHQVLTRYKKSHHMRAINSRLASVLISIVIGVSTATGRIFVRHDHRVEVGDLP